MRLLPKCKLNFFLICSPKTACPQLYCSTVNFVTTPVLTTHARPGRSGKFVGQQKAAAPLGPLAWDPSLQDDESDCTSCEIVYGANHVATEDRTSCELCPAGREAVKGVCEACPAGKASEGIDERGCTKCPEGSVSTRDEMVLCERCEAPRWTSGPGRTS